MVLIISLSNAACGKPVDFCHAAAKGFNLARIGFVNFMPSNCVCFQGVEPPPKQTEKGLEIP